MSKHKLDKKWWWVIIGIAILILIIVVSSMKSPRYAPLVPSTTGHLECISSMCKMVKGAGTDKCGMPGIGCRVTNSTNTTIPNFCGNGYVNSGESCDDGNSITTDSCIMCKRAFCGDGYVRTGVETCDDGNTISGDGCSSTCKIEIPTNTTNTTMIIKLCTDTDGFSNTTKGTVNVTNSTGSSTFTDTCISSIILKEYFCVPSTNNSESSNLNCTHVNKNFTCTDGACKITNSTNITSP